MFADLALPHLITLHGLVTVGAVLIYIVSSHLMHQRRSPAAAIAWMLFILLLPYMALPAFLMFGSRKLPRPGPAALRDLSRAHRADDWAVETIVALGQPAPAPYNDLTVHADGLQARDALLGIIDAAQTSIDLCTFMLGRDTLGEAVVDRLSRKALAGVRVRLLLDGMGSLMARRPDMTALIEAGGEFVLFVPPLRSPLKGRTNLRNHRKLLVADAGLPTARLWCGGRNLVAACFEGLPEVPSWRDLSFDLRGPLVGQASDLFEHDWVFAGGQPSGANMSTSDASALAIAGEGAHVVASGPDQADDTVYSLLITASYRARHRIALVTPYFVPDSALLMALCMAARRGVCVDLLLPARSNHRLSDLARSRALRSLAAAGGRIGLAPEMLHAKLAVIDDTLALAGSANIDSRSLFLNYELMLAFHKSGDVRCFAEWFEAERATARPYVANKPGLVRDVAEGMLLWVGFQL